MILRERSDADSKSTPNLRPILPPLGHIFSKAAGAAMTLPRCPPRCRQAAAVAIVFIVIVVVSIIVAVSVAIAANAFS